MAPDDTDLVLPLLVFLMVRLPLPLEDGEGILLMVFFPAFFLILEVPIHLMWPESDLVPH